MKSPPKKSLSHTAHGIPLGFNKRRGTLRREVLRKIKTELIRLAGSDKPEVIKFVRQDV